MNVGCKVCLQKRHSTSQLFFIQQITAVSNLTKITLISYLLHATRAVLRLVWPFDGIVQGHIHKMCECVSVCMCVSVFTLYVTHVYSYSCHRGLYQSLIII